MEKMREKREEGGLWVKGDREGRGKSGGVRRGCNCIYYFRV
jgi:predicted cupin superfamily sugar epimerase